jgi:thiol-disulfide isomerase/thioredoxin
MTLRDPWNDAQAIAQRLRQIGTELLVVVGAEAWCDKCRRLRPAFERLSAELPDHVLPMWLDLEDHAEFLGGFIPPDLPLLLRWRQGICMQAAVVEDIDLAATPAERVSLKPLVIEGSRVRDPHQGELVELPELWTEFAARSWASDSSAPS